MESLPKIEIYYVGEIFHDIPRIVPKLRCGTRKGETFRHVPRGTLEGEIFHDVPRRTREREIFHEVPLGTREDEIFHEVPCGTRERNYS